MSSLEEHFRKLERAYVRAPINQYYAPTIHISEGRAEITIPFKPDFCHAAGAIHGSVYFKALDDAAFFAANSLESRFFVLTASYNIYFLRPVSGGELRATGVVVHRGRSQYVAEATAEDSEGHVVARGSGTFVTSRIALTPEIGYG